MTRCAFALVTLSLQFAASPLAAQMANRPDDAEQPARPLPSPGPTPIPRSHPREHPPIEPTILVPPKGDPAWEQRGRAGPGASGRQHRLACARRYGSYDASTDLYTVRTGVRARCPL